MYLFTVTSPNMDFEKTFFGQLQKPCHALGFQGFAFCVARSGKTPVKKNIKACRKAIQNLKFMASVKLKHTAESKGCMLATKEIFETVP